MVMFWQAMKEMSVPNSSRNLSSSFNGHLQITLAVGIRQSQEVQQVRIPEDQIWRHAIHLLQGLQLLPGQLLRLAGNGVALVKHALDLLAQRSHAPALHPSHLGVELALQGIFR
jgi:hypothetical protein